MSLQIIRALPEHAHSLSEFSSAAFYDAYSFANTAADMQQYIAEHFSEQEILKEIGTQNTFIFLAVLDGKIAGYMKLGTATSPANLNGKPAIEIERLYVDKKLQSRKIGKAMMYFLKAFARNSGKKIVWLGVWKKNLRAVAFYEREGFKKFGETIFTLGRDLQEDFLMKKEL
ncbi:MAG: GNAT family N-acetyltransferase [Bacteroidota bacterium]|nr:GNAT family N-acetyltransferase [Bacteroidota bacterium]